MPSRSPPGSPPDSGIPESLLAPGPIAGAMGIAFTPSIIARTSRVRFPASVLHVKTPQISTVTVRAPAW